MTGALADEFAERFGLLSPGPKNPNNPADKAVALYDPNTSARRYVFDEQGRATDTRTGEVAFRIDGAGRTYLPNGREIATPRAVARPKPEDMAARLYGSAVDRPESPPARNPHLADEQRLAEALYGKGR